MPRLCCAPANPVLRRPPTPLVCGGGSPARARGQKQARLGLSCASESRPAQVCGGCPKRGDHVRPLSPQSFCAALHQELKEYYRLLSVLHSQVSPCVYFITI